MKSVLYKWLLFSTSSLATRAQCKLWSTGDVMKIQWKLRIKQITALSSSMDQIQHVWMDHAILTNDVVWFYWAFCCIVLIFISVFTSQDFFCLFVLFFFYLEVLFCQWVFWVRGSSVACSEIFLVIKEKKGKRWIEQTLIKKIRILRIQQLFFELLLGNIASVCNCLCLTLHSLFYQNKQKRRGGKKKST